MIDYKVYVNNGNEALGVDKKTITLNEDLQAVLQNFCKAAANLMSMVETNPSNCKC